MNIAHASYGSRNGFLINSCVVAVAISCLSIQVNAQTIFFEDHPHTHNMLVVGDASVFLYHLPMFDSLSTGRPTYTSQHRFQVILEATFIDGNKNTDDLYTADRRTHPSTKIYTLGPDDTFVLTRLVAPIPPASLITSFRGTVFRGHLEKGGESIAGLRKVSVNIKRVVYFREFDADLREKPGQLEYVLFGRGQDLFMAHLITRPPDFDQVLSVKTVDPSFTDQELSRGVRIVIPDSNNQAALRVKADQDIAGKITAVGGSASNPVKLRSAVELYFEEGELLVPPVIHETTEEERRAGFK
jgi:hypothetical protein